MNALVEKMANQAVFHLQFSTRDAIHYVMRNSNIDRFDAQQAIKSVMIFHKK
jgi:hypothetical protein